MRKTLATIGMLAILWQAGCGSSTGDVSGMVHFKGENLSEGTILFFTHGKEYEAVIRDGEYSVRNLPLGEAKIAIYRVDPLQPDPRGPLMSARKQSAENQIQTTPKAVLSDPTRLAALEKRRHLLPYRYASPDTSDLRMVVSSGSNRIDFHLVSDTPELAKQ